MCIRDRVTLLTTTQSYPLEVLLSLRFKLLSQVTDPGVCTLAFPFQIVPFLTPAGSGAHVEASPTLAAYLALFAAQYSITLLSVYRCNLVAAELLLAAPRLHS